jgi:hypothetical protein
MVCAGKTIFLVLQALRWLRQGDVHVISTLPASLSVSRLVERQLKETMAADVTSSSTYGNAIFHSYDFVNNKGDVDVALMALKAAARGGRPLAVVVDEALFGSRLVIIIKKNNLNKQDFIKIKSTSLVPRTSVIFNSCLYYSDYSKKKKIREKHSKALER